MCSSVLHSIVLRYSSYNTRRPIQYRDGGTVQYCTVRTVHLTLIGATIAVTLVLLRAKTPENISGKKNEIVGCSTTSFMRENKIKQKHAQPIA
jgi:hypothetical protein